MFKGLTYIGDVLKTMQNSEKSRFLLFFAFFCRFFTFCAIYFGKIQGCAESRMTSELRAHTDHSCAR